MKNLQKEERARALSALNDIQYMLFEDCFAQYEKGHMNEFWDDIENLHILFGLSNRVLEEDLMNSAA